MTPPHGQPDRRLVKRIALQLSATARVTGRNRTPVRIIYISTHGCRIEALSEFTADTAVWIGLGAFEPVRGRMAWAQNGFAGVEFEIPLDDRVLDAILAAGGTPTDSLVSELSAVAGRVRAARRRNTNPLNMTALQTLSRDCSVQAIVAGLRLSDARVIEAQGSRLSGAMIRRATTDQTPEPGFSFQMIPHEELARDY